MSAAADTDFASAWITATIPHILREGSDSRPGEVVLEVVQEMERQWNWNGASNPFGPIC